MSQTFLVADFFWFRKENADPHTPTQVNLQCPDDRYPKLKKLYRRTNFRKLRIDTMSIRNNALHDLSLITDCRWGVSLLDILTAIRNKHIAS